MGFYHSIDWASNAIVQLGQRSISCIYGRFRKKKEKYTGTREIEKNS